MKFMISYFYQVRFMKPYMIPISTAKWDPKWFHENLSQSHIFMDKNSVLNGIRADIFSPSNELSQYCINCKEKTGKCEFLKQYKNQLKRLDFD